MFNTVHTASTLFFKKKKITFPTYCGSEPIYSSRTKNWFHTHPLFVRRVFDLQCLLSLGPSPNFALVDILMSLALFAPLLSIVVPISLLRVFGEQPSRRKQKPTRRRARYFLVIIRERFCQKKTKNKKKF